MNATDYRYRVTLWRKTYDKVWFCFQTLSENCSREELNVLHKKYRRSSQQHLRTKIIQR